MHQKLAMGLIVGPSGSMTTVLRQGGWNDLTSLGIHLALDLWPSKFDNFKDIAFFFSGFPIQLWIAAVSMPIQLCVSRWIIEGQSYLKKGQVHLSPSANGVHEARPKNLYKLSASLWFLGIKQGLSLAKKKLRLSPLFYLPLFPGPLRPSSTYLSPLFKSQTWNKGNSTPSFRIWKIDGLILT